MSSIPLLSGIVAKASLPNPDPQIFPGASVWRPPQWSQPAQTVITVPASSQPPPAAVQGQTAENAAVFGALPGAPRQPLIYVFDAVLKLSHAGEVRLTEFPVQTGANISDHAIKLPKTLVLEVGMSDSMDSFVAGSWSGHSSKSVNCYQTMIGLRDSRVLVNVSTRLMSYSNMVLISVTSDDTNATAHGLRATLHFREVFLATVTASSATISFNAADVSGDSLSARPYATDTTPSGTVQLKNPGATVLAQHTVTPTTAIATARNSIESQAAKNVKVLGSGPFSSTNIADTQLTSTF
jgi:hypothetical protein